MATVCLAYDPKFGRNVAVKVLPQELIHNRMFRERFVREAAGTFQSLDGVAEYSVSGQNPENLPAGDAISVGSDTTIWTTSSNEVALQLSDETQIFLGPSTTIVVVSVYNPDTHAPAEIRVDQGQLLVYARQPVTVIASEHEFGIAEVDRPNAVMSIAYTPQTGSFALDCLSGECRLEQTPLEQGLRGSFDEGQALPLGGADYGTWLNLESRFSALAFMPIPTPTATPTPTNTPTPTYTPTPTPTNTPRPYVPPTATKKLDDDKPPGNKLPAATPTPTSGYPSKPPVSTGQNKRMEDISLDVVGCDLLSGLLMFSSVRQHLIIKLHQSVKYCEAIK